MGKHILHRLTPLEVRKKRAPGVYPDGGGLYLQVSPSGSKSWFFRYSRDGQERRMGLGRHEEGRLDAVRKEAGLFRDLLREGRDPIEARDQGRNEAKLKKAKTKTFRECAEAYVEAKRHGWKNAKHAAQWTATLRAHAYPVFGELPVAQVDTDLVYQVLEPLWRTIPETAKRLRGRMEAVLNWAKVRGYRTGENPALWRGHLSELLPKPRSVATVKHHAALPHGELPTFYAALTHQPGNPATALRFIILTAARTSETLGARWTEIDFDNRVWNVPGERMKMKLPHTVPLSVATLALLRQLKPSDPHGNGGYVFPGRRKNKPLSNMACLKLLERMGRADLTVHGFRSTFRDWAAESEMNFQREVIEACLAHKVAEGAEAAYFRSKLLEKRRTLMAAWSNFATSKTARLRRVA